MTGCPDRLADAAVAYATRLGWPVFPVRPRDKRPATTRGFHDATTDPDVIRAWWEQNPNYNIGVATGPPGPTVLDADGIVGRHELLKLAVGIGWHGVPWAWTQSEVPGWHLFYRGDPSVRCAAGIRPHLDVRGIGGYIVVAPSVGPSGTYRWDCDPFVHEPPVLPGPYREVLVTKVKPVRSISTLRTVHTVPPGYALSALAAEAAAVRNAAEGTRNHTLNRAAFAIGRFLPERILDAQLAVHELLAAAIAAGLTEREAEQTIQAGLRAGASRTA